MLFSLRDVLPEKLRISILEQLKDEHFIDGKATANGMARTVKSNQQVDLAKFPEFALEVTNALQQHQQFQYLAMPQRLSNLLISRYQSGMSYGTHTDGAIMPGGGRSDLSFTLMLSDGYEGGELCMETAFGEKAIRIPAGTLLLYPTGGLHRVAEVTKGERIAIVGWVQSRIRDPQKRQILMDLDLARKAYLEKAGHDRQADLMLKSSTNLRRMWDEG